MPTCPSGHPSESGDRCDECGLRIAPPAAAPNAGPAGAPTRPAVPPGLPAGPAFGAPEGGGSGGAPAEHCPRCGTPRDARAAYCEECRYHFTTFSPVPPPTYPVPADPYPPLSQRTTSGPSRINRPAEALAPEATVTPDSGDFLLPPPTAAGRTPSAEQSAPPPAAAARWVAVVTADREYFTSMMARSGARPAGLFFPQYSPEARVPLTEPRVTIGRRRHATGEAPDIDLSRPPEDPGVSHRHAALVRRADDGWSVVDEDSTNGTTVNGGEHAIEPFRPVDLAEGDRIHVGAWTTITLRQE